MLLLGVLIALLGVLLVAFGHREAGLACVVIGMAMAAIVLIA